MNAKTIPVDYANSLIFELQKAFWDERGRGARFRTTTVGQQYFKEKCLPQLDSSNLNDILDKIDLILRDEHIAGRVSYQSEDRMLHVRLEGCIHRPVEDRMVAIGIEPFTCLPANLIVLAIEQKLNQPVELAEIKLVDGFCELLLIIFEDRTINA